MDATWDQLPYDKRREIEDLVRRQVEGNSAADRAIYERTHDSLKYYIANLVRSFAQVLGYAIALPLSFAASLANEFVTGLSQGWEAGWNAGKTRY